MIFFKPSGYILLIFFFLFQYSYGQQTESPESLLSKYVQIESVTGNENDAAQFLLENCQKAGLSTHVFTNEKNSFNFAASLYPLEEKKPNIVFLNHCDVVHEGDTTKWTYPPYSGTITDDAVWGRGSIDNKAMGIMQLFALKEFANYAKENDLPYNFTMLTVSNEEKAGSLGAGIIVDNYLKILNPVVLYGEGGSGAKDVLRSNPENPVYGISIASKQAIWLQLSLKNEDAGHGAISTEKNVNKMMVKGLWRLQKKKPKLKVTEPLKIMLHQLSNYERGIIKFGYRHPGLILPFIKGKIRKNELLQLLFSNSINITSINTDQTSMNSVAGEINAIIDCRILETWTEEELLEYLNKRFRNTEVEIEVIRRSPRGGTSYPGQYFELMKQAVIQTNPTAAVVPMFFPAVTDNNYFRKNEVPSYGLLPCLISVNDIKRVHNIDERLPIRCLYEGINIYTSLIRLAIN